MNKLMRLSIFLTLSIFLSIQTFAAVYQWSVPLDGKDKDARAFLWIPSGCRQIRGVIFASQVILEDLFCGNEQIRNACIKEDLAIILVYRGSFTQFNYKEIIESAVGTGRDLSVNGSSVNGSSVNGSSVNGSSVNGSSVNGSSGTGHDLSLHTNPIQKVLDNLASVSGYTEISKAPLFTIGHSGGAIGAWNIANYTPSRLFGILTLHAAADPNPPYYDSKTRIGCIPVMAVSGEYESWGNKMVPLDQHWRWLRGDLLDRRGKYLNSLVCEVVQPGAGHFNFDEHLAKLSAMFLQKAAHYRIPATTSIGDSVALKYLDEKNGWYTDIKILSDERFKPVAAKDFKGDPSLAFWHFDEEMAKAVDVFPSLYGGKKEQRVCFVQNNTPVAAGWINELAFQPASDGISFGLKGGFLKETPEGVANAGIPLGYSTSNHIKFSLIGGWSGGGVQFAPDSFRIQYRQFGTTRFAANIQIMAYHEGDAVYKYAEQAGQIKFPDKNKDGLQQTITFPEIDGIKKDTKSISLKAVSSVGLPVYYYVKEGPATIKGNQLLLDEIPPRSKFPIKLTIVAWQYGRSIAPQIQTATPVEQVVYIKE